MSSILQQPLRNLKQKTLSPGADRRDMTEETENIMQHVNNIKIIRRIPDSCHVDLVIFESHPKIYVYFTIDIKGLNVQKPSIASSQDANSPRCFITKPIGESCLFSMNQGLEDDLDKKDDIYLPEKLVKEFEMKNFSLPETPICTKKGDTWEITDEKREKTYYVIRKEEEKLSIYNKPIDFDTFRNDLSKHIENRDERGVINLGIQLRDELVPKEIQTELQNENEKFKDVWIFCEEKNIDFLWEWIYLKEMNFFWGDKFCIVRKPKDRIPENYEAEDPNFKIEEVNILLDENSHPARRDRKCLRDLRIVDREIKLNDPNAQNNLKASDCIHIAADREQFIHARSLLTALKLSKNIKFLFLNIWGPEVSRDLHIMRWINSISAKTWIYTILNVPPDFGPFFAKCFYECVAKEKNVAEAVRKTREEIGKGYLFCVTDGNLKKDLNIPIIPERLKKKFNDEGIQLSNNVTIRKENEKWTITDEEKRNIYIAMEKDGKLKIYETGRNSGCKKFWRLAYVVKGNP